jgi:hypothetical protein
MHKCKSQNFLLAVVIICLFITGLLGAAPARAASPNISHSYRSDGGLSNGSLVSLDPAHSGYVQLANTTNGPRLLGVVVANNESLLAVDASNTTTQVATAGTANVLASTLGGPIAAGDQISVSPFDGIGIKAIPDTYAIGLAETSLNSNSPNTITKDVTNKSNHTTKTIVGYVRVSIAVGLSTNPSSSSNNLSSLQRLAQSLTGHTVSTWRVIVSIVITVVALITLITLIYSSIRSTILSIGRNPMAESAIMRTLVLVVGVAVLTAEVAIFIVYLLLR